MKNVYIWYVSLLQLHIVFHLVMENKMHLQDLKMVITWIGFLISSAIGDRSSLVSSNSSRRPFSQGSSSFHEFFTRRG